MKEEGYSGVNSVMVVLERSDLKAFSSRIFRIQPGGHTAMHVHEREHVAVVLRGACRVECDSEVRDVGEGGMVSIASNAPHRFSNPSKDRLVLLIMNFHVAQTSM